MLSDKRELPKCLNYKGAGGKYDTLHAQLYFEERVIWAILLLKNDS